GGWRLGGTFTHQTGGVATPLDGFDNASIAPPFGNFDRPDPTGVSPYLQGSARTLSDWVNKAAYVYAPSGFFGTLQRGSFTGPGYTNLDAALHKQFAMPYNEKHQLAIRFEAFNALNHPNWGIPNLTVNSSNCGRCNWRPSTSSRLRPAGGITHHLWPDAHPAFLNCSRAIPKRAFHKRPFKTELLLLLKRNFDCLGNQQEPGPSPTLHRQQIALRS